MGKHQNKSAIPLEKLVLRCYGRQLADDNWYGVCINLNLAVEASSREELVEEMSAVIKSYLETVLDTKDVKSIPELLSRKAPLSDQIMYYLIACIYHINNIPKNKFFKFKEFIPFHFAHNRC